MNDGTESLLQGMNHNDPIQGSKPGDDEQFHFEKLSLEGVPMNPKSSPSKSLQNLLRSSKQKIPEGTLELSLCSTPIEDPPVSGNGISTPSNHNLSVSPLP